MNSTTSASTGAMEAPTPFRLAILFDDADAASLARAATMRNGFDPTWFAPELWPAGLARFSGLMRLAWQLRSRRPAALYAPSSRGANWGAILGVLFGIPVVTDSPRPGIARLARLVRGRYAAVGLDAAASSAKTSSAMTLALPAIEGVEHVLREVLQMGSSWTTTGDGRLPIELALGAGSGGSAMADRVEERGVSRPDRSVRLVGRPTLTVFLPERRIATGTAIVICPGGGYAGVTIDKEGHDVARWLAARGIAGLVLKYRLPQSDRGGAAPPLPMADLDEALAVTRAHATVWGIRSDRIGAMGFSAGGHMVAWASRSVGSPAFAILVYPVISMDRAITHAGSRKALLGKSPSDAMAGRYSFERAVTPDVCPTFVVHARDDTVAKPENSFVYLEALRAATVPVEAMICDHGGHGFGLGIHGGEVANWPDRCIEWIATTIAARWKPSPE
ncbi:MULTISPECIES: alpha/beta hydrolase [unclassified Bradyrhizobium]|uniref:alpha/beta hydrolase n=1 Tax=unclassified Bradyrhizobium TaxID=2631580 RepID=UPI0028E46CD6|nr:MULTISPECIES: alpha/beta hydrolase [unclassified Bradyrhizobium]